MAAAGGVVAEQQAVLLAEAPPGLHAGGVSTPSSFFATARGAGPAPPERTGPLPAGGLETLSGRVPRGTFLAISFFQQYQLDGQAAVQHGGGLLGLSEFVLFCTSIFYRHQLPA